MAVPARVMITTAPAPADDGSPAMAPPSGAPGLVAWYAEGFSDVLGDRLGLFDNAGPALELLRFAPRVTGVPGFESAVRARVDALAGFVHPAFARVRKLTVLDDPRPQLALVTELAPGERLSTVLRAADARGARLDPTSAIWLLRQVLPALAAFHDATGGASHRLLDADRIILTAGGEIAITEYVFGGVAEDLLPAAPRATDVGQTALLAVAVLRGRPVRPDEQEGDFARLVHEACDGSPSADVLRPWLLRAVSAGPDAFRSAREAYHALDTLLPGIWGHRPAASQGADALVPATARRRRGADLHNLPQRELLALPAAADVARTRRLWRINRALTAVVMAEAVCIAALLAHILGSVPMPLATPSAPVSIAAAGMIPTRPSVPPVDAEEHRTAAPVPSGTAVAAAATPDSVIGTLAIESPIAVKVYINGRLLGDATNRRFGVPAGDHLITLASETAGFRSSQTVRIVAGQSVLVTARPE